MELYFDRGTIVLESGGPSPPSRRSAPAARSQALPAYFLWDARIERWRAPAYRLAAFQEWLGARGVEAKHVSSRPSGFRPLKVDASDLPTLRPYQREALEAWTAAGRRGLISLPTGSGKTRVAVSAILSLGRPALVVVPTRQLAHQWRATFRDFYPGAVGLYGDGQRGLEPITVATYDSAFIHLDRFGDHFDVLVVDEAHHLAAEKLADVAQMTTAPCRMGISATFPALYEQDSERQKVIEDLLGPLCFWLPVAHLSGTYLANVETRIVSLRLSPAEQQAYDRSRRLFLLHFRPFVSVFPTAEWSDFVRTASRSAGGRQALAALRRSREITNLAQSKLIALDQLLHQHREERVLIFAGDTGSAYEISRRFLLPAITCEIEREERETVLGRFADGTYRALVSARVLNEGFDVPAASVAIVAGGSSSPVEHAQRVGRVLRPQSGKVALVYELVVAKTGEWAASERRSRSGVLDGSPAL